MSLKMDIDLVYAPSENVVARNIQDEFILIPIAAGIGDMEDQFFSLNNTGKMIWEKMDGKKSLRDIAKDLALEFEAPIEEIEKDVVGIVGELSKRSMITELKRK
ncbi:PqqD family peptide modification chaperone [Candidatus Omnitrophota bacterium]